MENGLETKKKKENSRQLIERYENFNSYQRWIEIKRKNVKCNETKNRIC